MERAELFEQVRRKRQEGLSIRAIASQLGVHRSRVHRAALAISREEGSQTGILVPAHSQHSIGGRPFVGRQQERKQLEIALEDALDRRGRIVMLVGEPGIGKTRTAQELMAYSVPKGYQNLTGRCHSTRGAPPFWPWIQAVRSYVMGLSQQQLRSQLGPGAEDIAEVIPEIKNQMPDLGSPPAIDAEEAKFRFFDSFGGFLVRASEARPLLIFLDNLHWADRSSLLLLEFLAQQWADSRLLLVGTYRDTELNRRHPLSQTLGELSKETFFQRLPLRGLSEDEVAQYIERAVGFTPQWDLVKEVHNRTEGNPLFMVQVVQLLLQEGEITADWGRKSSWNLLIPLGVREVIGRRLDQLSEDCNDTLKMASVIGREFDLDLLSYLLTDFAGAEGQSLSEDQVLGALSEALAAGVIEEVPSYPNRYQFSHVLIQDTLVRELLAARRQTIHRRIALFLEDLYRDAQQVHAVELAHHFEQAANQADREKLAYYSWLAGEQALITYAHDEARTHFDRGLDAKGVDLSERTPIDDALVAALIFGRVKAQVNSEFTQMSSDDLPASLWRAFNFYADSNDVEQAVAIAEFPDYSLRWSSLIFDLFSSALEIVPRDSHQEARLLHGYAQRLGIDKGDFSGAQRAFDRALAIARSEGDSVLEMQTLVDAAGVDVYHLRWHDAIGKTSAAAVLAEKLNDPRAEVTAHYFAISSLISLGDLEGAIREGSAMLAPAERLRDRFWSPGAFWKNGICFRLAGDWEKALDFNDQCLALAGSRSSFLSDRVLLECELGNFEQAGHYRERFLNAPSSGSTGGGYIAMLLPFVSRITGEVRGLDLARETAEGIITDPYVNPNALSRSRAGLALLSVLEENSEEAITQYEELKSCHGTMLWWMISADRLLGLLATTAGQFGQADLHFEDALSFCERAAYLPEWTWTAYDYACCLFKRGHPSDSRKARLLLEQALTNASELKMAPLTERILDLNRPSVLGADQPPDGLTERELQVLYKVAAGRSNNEISDQLFLSIRTVERHITNIYTKINAHNRAEAIAYAINHGLAE